jgi:ribosomal-protein-alanine N-acetyltransferase
MSVPLHPRASGDIAVRPANSVDLDRIVEIEASSFGSPWTMPMYIEELRRKITRLDVAVVGERIVGSICSWHFSDEVHLMRIAVDPTTRRLGIASVMLSALVTRAHAMPQCDTIELEVGASNEAAMKLYRGMGFVVVGRRRGYYNCPPDDALLMRLRIR